LKKIALASAAMGGAALIAFGASGTFASFSDSQTVSGNQAGSGTLTVSANRQAEVTTADVSIAPGSSSRQAYYVVNDAASDVNGLINGVITVGQDLENGCNDPETAAGDKSCAWNEGEFSGLADVTVYSAFTAADECDATLSANAESAGKLNSGTRVQGQAPVVPGAGVCVVLEISLPDSVDNAVQGDSSNFTATFTLEQVTQGNAVPGGVVSNDPTEATLGG
jgi:predicted ribosomally synthesized peptide with SipW-like signal peptide